MKCGHIGFTVTLLLWSHKTIGYSLDLSDEPYSGDGPLSLDSSESSILSSSPETHEMHNSDHSDMSNSSPDFDSPEFISVHIHSVPPQKHNWHRIDPGKEGKKVYQTTTTKYIKPKEKRKTTTETPQKTTMETKTKRTVVTTTESPKKRTVETKTKRTVITKTKRKVATTTESPQTITAETRTKRTVEATTEFTSPVTIGTATVSTREIENCILYCPVTSEYNPVCGTNLITYTNPGRLICAKRCGLDVDLLKSSSCSQNVPSTTTTSTTAQPSTGPTMVSLFFSECTKSCDSSNEWRPVCGSNDVTYKNAQYLLCVQYCGVDVRLVRFAACPTADVSTTSTTPKSVETITQTESIDVVSKTIIQFCVRACPVTSEHNPVCGTGDVTYKNPSALQCLITCGINVQLKYPSACVKKNGNNNIQQVTSTTSVPDQVTMPLPPYVEFCFNACPVLSEDRPICGTDGVTYKNPSELQCARICGVNVRMKHRQACPQEISSTTTQKIGITTPTPSETTTVPNNPDQRDCIVLCRNNLEYNPVCGSNDVTYNNLQHLACVQSCRVEVTLVTYYACTETSVVSSDTTDQQTENQLTTNSPVITTNPIGVEQSLIDSVFNQTNTSVMNADYIDPRFGVRTQ